MRLITWLEKINNIDTILDFMHANTIFLEPDDTTLLTNDGLHIMRSGVQPTNT